MAHDSEIDRTYPSLMERGQRTPTLLMLIKLGYALEVEPALLVAMATTQLRQGMFDEGVLLDQLFRGVMLNASTPLKK